MFLKSLDINGFKSFADKTHIDFADGITSLLGPNGCGKSNIVDSIKWVLGEQSTKTLRAGRMEDVIFNGTDSRKPLQFAEVALTIDNSERKLPTDMTEVEIKRRVFRSGESEYYINKNRCLLKNIRELFFDTGVGKSAYSILEQGKIDQILSQRPEDRRYIFEEAAGISRFKVECNEAQKKIERTNDNIAEVELLNKGEKRRFESLRAQAEKAKSYNDLVKKQLLLDSQVHISKLKGLAGNKTIRMEQNENYRKSLVALKESLSSFNSGIDEAQRLMRESSEKSTSIQYSINRAEEKINASSSTISLLEDRYREYLANKKSSEEKAQGILINLDRDRNQLDELSQEMLDKEERLKENEEQVKRAIEMISENTARIAALNEEAEKGEELIIEKEKEIEELSQRLKSVIENLAVELDEKMGEEYSAIKRQKASDALSHKIETLYRRIEDKINFYKGVPESTKDLKGKVVKDFEDLEVIFLELKEAISSYQNTIPPFIDSLLAPGGLLTEKREISEKENLLRGEIERTRKLIASDRSSASSLQIETNGLRDTASQMNAHVASMKASLDSSKQVVENLKRSVQERELDYSDAQSEALNYEKRSVEVHD